MISINCRRQSSRDFLTPHCRISPAEDLACVVQSTRERRPDGQFEEDMIAGNRERGRAIGNRLLHAQLVHSVISPTPCATVRFQATSMRRVALTGEQSFEYMLAGYFDGCRRIGQIEFPSQLAPVVISPAPGFSSLVQRAIMNTTACNLNEHMTARNLNRQWPVLGRMQSIIDAEHPVIRRTPAPDGTAGSQCASM